MYSFFLYGETLYCLFELLSGSIRRIVTIDCPWYLVHKSCFAMSEEVKPTVEVESQSQVQQILPDNQLSTKASKTSISCEASSTFQGTSFQNEHFVRDFLNFSKNKLPKRVFRARLPQLFKRQASKTSISCETSATFQATSFQNEHFVRDFLDFSKNKLSKRAFRARLPQLFKRQASKTSISCETSSSFQRTS